MRDCGQLRFSVRRRDIPLFVAVLFAAALLWAKAHDPFRREWLSLRTSSGQPFSAIAVMPDHGGPFPVVVWCHGSGGSLESSGETLRQFAALGLAAVGFDYDQTNQANFDAQFATVLDEIERKPWAKANQTRTPQRGARHVAQANLKPETRNLKPSAPETLQPATPTAWVGHSLGAQRQLSFLVRHPEQQPAALVRLNGGMVEELKQSAEQQPSTPENLKPETRNPQPSTPKTLQPATFNLQLATPLSAWLAHGQNDEIFPASDARKVAEALRAAGAEVRLDVFPGRSHNFGEDQPLLVRQAAEFCTEALGGAIVAPVKARSANWIYWLPVALLGVVVWRCRAACTAGVPPAGLSSLPPDAAPGGGMSPVLAPSGRGLRRFAFAMALAAGLVSAAHLVLPLLPVSPTTIKLARQWNVRPELRADFDWLMSQPGAAGCRLRDLLDHLTLASLQRGQFGASLPEPEWREFVLSPWIEGQGGELGWRRELWEWLAPRVRRETGVREGALQVVRRLRLQVRTGADSGTQRERTVLECWRADEAGPAERGALAVAALRAAGIPAQLKGNDEVMILAEGQWIRLPEVGGGVAAFP